MKPRCLAILILVVIATGFLTACERRPAFWLLLTPPINYEAAKKGGDPTVDTNASLTLWTPAYHVFGSFSECEQMRQAMVASASNNEYRQKMKNMFKNFGNGQIKVGPAVDASASMLAHATCVSSDDFRLRDN